MKVKGVTLENFSVFKKVNVDFSPGLNVFIGANATGKSHLMKLLYAVLKVLEPRPKRSSLIDYSPRIQEKLAMVFMPDKSAIGRLVRRAPGGGRKARVELHINDCSISFDLTARGKLSLDVPDDVGVRRCIFIPSREALAMFDGFLAAYEDRELSFDETYRDLCVALSAKPLRGKRTKGIAGLMKPLESIVGGAVALEGGRFQVHSSDGIIEAHLLSEGFRKIAGLICLIGNGSLTKNSLLFWDEPEANLNPKLVARIAETLRILADCGVQVFIATHDYLLSHELSLAVEYQTKPKAPTRFFAFHRDDSGPVSVQAGDTLADLEHNPILEEFAAHYDRERELFSERAREGEKEV